MQSSSDDKPRRILTFAELALAIRERDERPSPPEFTAEGTGVERDPTLGPPPKPRTSSRKRRTSQRLVVGMGVVATPEEVPPEMVRSGALEMRSLAEAYGIAVSRRDGGSPETEPSATNRRLPVIVPPDAATVLLPPLRPGQRKNSAMPLALGAMLCAALVIGTAAATIFALRTVGGSTASAGSAPASERAAALASDPAQASEPVVATPVVDPPAAEKPAQERIREGEQRTRRSGKRIREGDQLTRRSGKRIRERPQRIGERPAKRVKPRRSAPATASAPKPAPAVAACDERACLLSPELACCGESVTGEDLPAPESD